MSISTSNTTGNIELRLICYHDCDDVQLFWRTKVDGQMDGTIPNCLELVFPIKIARQQLTNQAVHPKIPISGRSRDMNGLTMARITARLYAIKCLPCACQMVGRLAL